MTYPIPSAGSLWDPQRRNLSRWEEFSSTCEGNGSGSQEDKAEKTLSC